jgi:hypothetical protein
LREITEGREQGVDENAQAHGPDTTDPISKPSKNNPATSRSNQKRSSDPTHPATPKAVVKRGSEAQQCRPGDHGEKTHFEPVEEPA